MTNTSESGPLIKDFHVIKAGRDGLHFADGVPDNLQVEGVKIDEAGRHGLYVGKGDPPVRLRDHWYNRPLGRSALALGVALCAAFILWGVAQLYQSYR
jgi:hypothetical protein